MTEKTDVNDLTAEQYTTYNTQVKAQIKQALAREDNITRLLNEHLEAIKQLLAKHLTLLQIKELLETPEVKISLTRLTRYCHDHNLIKRRNRK